MRYLTVIVIVLLLGLALQGTTTQIPAYTSIPRYVGDEIATGVVDGANTTYGIANTPNPTSSLQAYLYCNTNAATFGGQPGAMLRFSQAEGDFTISGTTLDFSAGIGAIAAPIGSSNCDVLVSYTY